MRQWLLTWFFVFGCLSSLLADSPVSFSPALPSSWFVKADKDTTVENMKGHVVVIARTNDSCTIMITATQLSKEDAAKDFKQNGRNFCKALVDPLRGNYKLTESKLTFKTEGGRKIAEEVFHIDSEKGVVHGFVRCWISNGRAFSWIALSTDELVDKQKEIFDIAASIKFAE